MITFKKYVNKLGVTNSNTSINYLTQMIKYFDILDVRLLFID